MDRLLLMNSFVRAVETGSFSSVARELRTSQPSVSRYVAVLEQHLGTRLLHRSTRKLTLTPEGERYYSEARRILDAVSEAESNARGEDKPKGLLRIACSVSIGRIHVVPRIQTFLERYPEVEIDAQISDRYVDLVEEGLDLAIRIGPLKDSSLKARPIGVSERACVASSEYLARHGTPRTPKELLDHNCITFTLTSTGDGWPFHDGEIAVRGNFRVNTPDGIYSAVTGGLGIGYGPLWLFEDALATRKVQLILREYIGPPAPINIVYSARRLLPSRATVFMNFMAEEFSRIPVLQEGTLARVSGAMPSVALLTRKTRRRDT
jgi:LysR family transcriptional regulator, regulator for bpeEF and oprC